MILTPTGEYSRETVFPILPTSQSNAHKEEEMPRNDQEENKQVSHREENLGKRERFAFWFCSNRHLNQNRKG